MEIWELAEMGYLENESSALLQKTLSDEGFSIKKGVAGIPTAFTGRIWLWLSHNCYFR